VVISKILERVCSLYNLWLY